MCYTLSVSINRNIRNRWCHKMKAIDRFAFEPEKHSAKHFVIVNQWLSWWKAIGWLCCVRTTFFTNCTKIDALCVFVSAECQDLCTLPFSTHRKNKIVSHSISYNRIPLSSTTHISFSFFRSCCDGFGVDADVYLFTLHSHCFVFFRFGSSKSNSKEIHCARTFFICSFLFIQS